MVMVTGGVPVNRVRGRMQTARPRDFGALALVVGLFLVLLVVSIALGSPAVR